MKDDTIYWTGVGCAGPIHYMLIVCSLHVKYVMKMIWCEHVALAAACIWDFSSSWSVGKALKQFKSISVCNDSVWIGLRLLRSTVAVTVLFISALGCSLEPRILGCATHSNPMKWSVLWLILGWIIKLLGH